MTSHTRCHPLASALPMWEGTYDSDESGVAYKALSTRNASNRQRFITAHFDKCIREWDASTRERKAIRELHTDHEQAITAVVLNPDRSALGGLRALDVTRRNPLFYDRTFALTCGKDSTLKLIDLMSFTVERSYRCEGSRGREGERERERVMVRSSWNLGAGSDPSFRVGTNGCVPSFSPDGRFFAVGSADGSIKIWNVQGGIHSSLERGGHK